MKRLAEFTAEPEDWYHGTQGGYTWHKCRCQRCRAAHAAYSLAWKESKGLRQTRTPRPLVHGTLHAYRYRGCRCVECKAANARARREYQARRRAGLPHDIAAGSA